MKLACSFAFLTHELGDPAAAMQTVKTTFSRSAVNLECDPLDSSSMLWPLLDFETIQTKNA